MGANSQLLKGLMEGVIIKIISKKETYGYEIYSILQELGFQDFSEGSLYPLLLRIERKGLIRGVKKSFPDRPDRKYYFLTEEGEKYLVEFKSNWDKINTAMYGLWSE